MDCESENSEHSVTPASILNVLTALVILRVLERSGILRENNWCE